MNLKRRAPERFAAVASWLYRLLAQPSLEPLYRRVAAEIPIRRGRLLDVGCGTGRLIKLIAADRPELAITGLDASAEMLAQVTRDPAPEIVVFRRGAIESAGFDAEFDFAVTLLSFHHWEEPREALEAVYRALVPGGKFWIYEPDPEASVDDIRHDHAPFFGWLRLPTWFQRRMSRGHGFSRHEIEEVVRPLVAQTSFAKCEVSRHGSTLRLELRRA